MHLRFLRLGFLKGSCTATVCVEILNLVHASLTWCSKTTPGGDLLLLEIPWKAGSPGFAGTESFHAVTTANVFRGAFTDQQLLLGLEMLAWCFSTFCKDFHDTPQNVIMESAGEVQVGLST